MILSCLFIAATETMGRGVFTSGPVEAGTVVKTSPVIIMSKEERELPDQTRLYDYIFELGAEKNKSWIALGYVPVYNHFYKSNCEYEMPARPDSYRVIRSDGDFDKDVIKTRKVHFTNSGEDFFINYNHNGDDGKLFWFENKKAPFRKGRYMD